MNWKEKEHDWVENGERIRVKVLDCKCGACWYSNPMPKELAAKVKDQNKLLCRRLDMVVSPDQEPCNSFQ